MPGIELNVVVAYVFGLIVLYLVGWILLVPLKFVFKLIFNGLIGGIVLLIINLIGGFAGIHIGVNPITALVTGVLGVPGVALLLVLQVLFKV